MITNLNDYVVGGYFLARPIQRRNYMNPELLPDKIFSASHCIGQLIPDILLALNWEHLDEKKQRESGPQLGVEEAQVPELVKWIGERLKSQQIGWGNVFYSPEVARNFVEHFRIPTQNLVLFSTGLQKKYVSLFVEETASPEKISPSGIWLMVQKGVTAEQGGISMGYDTLGYELAWAHSWLCYSFEKEASANLGIRPNQHGFIDSLEDAERIAELANNSDAPIENKPWLPWLVTVHPVMK